MMNIVERLHRFGNLMGIVLISLALTYTLYDQLMMHDLPCPLCLLQRACMIAVGIGMSMNLLLGIRARHYGVILLSALSGMFIAVRQIFLHIAPGNPSYGDAIFGLHFYTWAAITFCIIIGCCAIALLLEQGFNKQKHQAGIVIKLVMTFFTLLIVANIISTFLECGLSPCVANPINYIGMDHL